MAKKRGKNRARKKHPVKKPSNRATPIQSAAAPKPVAAAKKVDPRKTAALTFVMLAAVALGVWFAVSPILEKNRILERQSELLASIEQGGGVIVLDEAFAAAEVDFYDDNNGETLEPDVFPAAFEPTGPDPEDSVSAETAAFDDTVVTGTGVLTIEKIDARLPVTEGVSTAQLQVAVGHVPQTPEVGEIGNAVIAGHRSYTYGQFFNRLDEVEVGDVISYQPKDGGPMEFAVCEILEALPGDAAAVWQPENERMLTLLTCTPIKTATHRLLIRATLIV